MENKRDGLSKHLYVVVITYSFDFPEVFLFDDEKKALTYLKKVFDEDVRIRTENGVEVQTEFSPEGTYARIQYIFPFCDEADTTEYFFLPEIRQEKEADPE